MKLNKKRKYILGNWINILIAMVKILVEGNPIVLAHPVRWRSPHKRGMTWKNYTYTNSKAQAKQRLKLAEAAHALRDKVTGFKLYRGRSIPVVAATIAPDLTGMTSGFRNHEEWYKAHRASNEAVEAEIAKLKQIADVA